jgi:1-acyl-sn-glycerol-3-phosphate acyltransferase
VKLALRTGAPIVPVAIVGAEEAMPLLGKLPGRFLGLPYLPLTSPLPLPSRWLIRVGEPLDVEGYGPEAKDDLVLVQKLNERTREAVQTMLLESLQARPSVF